VSTSDVLRTYPQDLLSSPLRVVRATVSFGAGAGGSFGTEPAPAIAGTEERSGTSAGAFAALATGALTPAAVGLALVFALGFGALHAMGPGHGKTIMAAYLVGSSGRIRQAVGVAVAVAGMHTASVLAVGLIVVSAERAFPAERIYPWLGLVSGALVMALGATILATRLARGTRRHDHRHAHPTNERPLSPRGLAVLAASGGLLPSPTAIIVLLASIALGRAAFGVALVGAFSLGLAASLALVGVLAVRARSHLAPRLGRWARLLPLGSASAIAAVGALLVVRAAAQL
jgi:ABC-type nickel/cobalt efflux system permease component RcnA